jgi:hypothetical protein
MGLNVSPPMVRTHAHHKKLRTFLTPQELHVVMSKHGLHYCIARPRGAVAGQGHAFIARSYRADGTPIRRDLSRVEVTESSFTQFLAWNGKIGVFHYEGDADEWLHIGWLPGMAPRGVGSLRTRQRRRRQALAGGRIYRGYRQKVPESRNSRASSRRSASRSV